MDVFPGERQGHCQSILQTVGNTPLIRLNRVSERLGSEVFAKVEGFNPGHSAKDRVALYMIEKAEREGRLKPGATIIEATSGNTGFSLAMVSRLKGYECILTLTSKASGAKLRLLRSMGAKVVVCPSEVTPEDPRSYYSQAARLTKEIPGAFYVNQNFDPANADAHYYSTGPEIWRQTGGQITHYICCVGTGGTISGTSRFLKEQNPELTVVGVDAYGSVLQKYWETGLFDEQEIFPYKIEGLGKTIIPGNVNFELIDKMIKVNDRDSAFRCREVALEEGIFVGYSSGAALQALYKLKNELKPHHRVVVLLPDHGSRYLSKVYSDEWMEEQGFSRSVRHSTYSTQLYRRYRVGYRRLYHKVNHYLRKYTS
jgi:cystathionine beta-synthase